MDGTAFPHTRLKQRLRYSLDSGGWAYVIAPEILGAVGEGDLLKATYAARQGAIDPNEANGHSHRYGRALFQPETGILMPIEPVLKSGRRVHRYTQEPCPIAELVGFYPDVEAIPGYLVTSPWVQGLVAFAFDVCPRSAMPRDTLYEVGLHLRVGWTSWNKGMYEPHLRRYRQRMTAVFLLDDTANLFGGETVIAGMDSVGKHPDDVDDRALTWLTLRRPLDGYIFDGRRVATAQSVMRSGDGLVASRSTLTIDFCPIQVLLD